MKLDVTCMRFLTKDDFRVLVAVEMGMRNHELVPIELITSIAKLRHGGSHKILSTLLRYKLVAHASNDYNGYRLSYMGFDILALRALLGRGVIASVGRQIGVGKESDIFEAMDENGNEVVLKIHRLGRTSFRAVRRQRDYMKGKSKASWLYMSRLAAIKEFAFMKALYANGFPTPIPIDQSRHVVAMSKVNGFPMAQIKAGKMEWAEEVFSISLRILKRLAEHGLVHCDFNEFNLMVDEVGQVTLIDFPQMVSTSHLNASELFARDLNGLVKFFAMKMRYIPPDEMLVKLEDIVVSEGNTRIDEMVRASGFSKSDDDDLLGFISRCQGDDDDDDDCDGAAEGEEEDEEADDAAGGATTETRENGHGGGGGADEQIIVRRESDDDGHPQKLSSSDDAQHNVDRDGGGSGADEEDEDLLTGSDEDEGEGVGGGAPTPKLSKTVLDRVRERTRDMRRRSGGGRGGVGSRNMTKKINKYGRVDKSQKVDASSGW